MNTAEQVAELSTSVKANEPADNPGGFPTPPRMAGATARRSRDIPRAIGGASLFLAAGDVRGPDHQ